MKPANRKRSQLRELLRHATDPDELAELAARPASTRPAIDQRRERTRSDRGRPRHNRFPDHKRQHLAALERTHHKRMPQ